MTWSPAAKDLVAVSLVATPRDGTSPTPTKEFVLTAPLPPVVTLEMGDFGAPLTVTGTARSLRGEPIANAQVLLEGTVVGDGKFRSQVVTTSSTGAFSLTALPGKGAMTLTIVPPPESTSAVTSSSVKLPAASGPLLDVLPCDDRVLLTGKVVLPNGAAAGGVSIHAIEKALIVSSAPPRPLPLDPVDALTGEDGVFFMRLDPATWRLDLTPSVDLPLASRLVTVEAMPGANKVQTLPSNIPLAAGRTVSGSVVGQLAAKADSPLAFATLRFFRVRPVNGQASAILLGTALADERGRYSVTLPTTR